MKPLFSLLVFVVALSSLQASEIPWETTGQPWLDAYFEAETKKLAEATLSGNLDKEDWLAQRPHHLKRLKEMLGLWPDRERTPLMATVTATNSASGVIVENLHFQSSPGLYVTGNLYRPTDQDGPLPAILYVCGHGRVKKDGVSYGNKTHYQHHGAWFARNGYVCLTIDTIQLGELEGHHHGTHHLDMWWWNSRGYTPAGVEAWNGIRAVDYLQSRSEVDPERIGMTGRSGGGSYSWWTAALDERIKAVIPVAGITDMENHVVDGCIEGHCDCMFMVNTYRWDFAMVAAMIAPRPLLIANTDKDRIFPLDGVIRVHEKAAKVYKTLDASDKLGVVITEGPHADTQPLRIPAFHWLNRHLRGDESPVTMVAEKLFSAQQLKVFTELPEDEITTRIHDTFVPEASSARLPKDASEWNWMRNRWRAELERHCFAGWPEDVALPESRRVGKAASGGISLEMLDFESQEHVPMRLYKLSRESLSKPGIQRLSILDADDWSTWMKSLAVGFPGLLSEEMESVDGGQDRFEEIRSQLLGADETWYVMAPRGIGMTAPLGSIKKQRQIRRRYQLLGQTVDAMRVWDIRSAIRVIRSLSEAPIHIQGKRDMATNVLMASVFESGVKRVDLWELSSSFETGPDYLNIIRFVDLPTAVALSAEMQDVHLHRTEPHGWDYPMTVALKLGWTQGRFQVHGP